MKSAVRILKPLSLTFLLGLTACGGGGGGGGLDSSGTSSSTSSGLFLDAEVNGLSFTTSSGLSGQTDEFGTYAYRPGDQITFAVGGVEIGSVPGAPKCTPFDFGAASTNIARFLQSLDADNDPTNGIDIAAANTALAGTSITSDSFTVDEATFTADAAIATAVTTGGGGALVDAATATANLNAGTDSTFDNAELEGKLFVVLDPVENSIGIISFDTIASGAEVFDVFSNETTAAGDSGLGNDATWAVNGSGVLTITDLDGTVTTVNKVGASTRAISVTLSEPGFAVQPATVLIPRSITAADVGGVGVGVGTATTSKTYDVIDIDGSPFSITFKSDKTYTTTDGETGTYEVSVAGPNAISLVDDAFPNEVAFVLVMDGDLSVMDQAADILILGAEAIGGLPSDPDMQFNVIGVGSLTLKSTTP